MENSAVGLVASFLLSPEPTQAASLAPSTLLHIFDYLPSLHSRKLSFPGKGLYQARIIVSPALSFMSARYWQAAMLTC